jgi:hypothetical protein
MRPPQLAASLCARRPLSPRHADDDSAIKIEDICGGLKPFEPSCSGPILGETDAQTKVRSGSVDSIEASGASALFAFQREMFDGKAMKTFTVHLPRNDYAAAAEPEAALLARAVFVREGFSWGAFFFGPLWLIWRGLWIALIVWLVIVIALSVASAVYLSGQAQFFVSLAIALFLGLEGNKLRRAELARRGTRFVDVVTAASRDAAEQIFFTRWLNERPVGPPPPPPMSSRGPMAPSDPHNAVLGHFPLPEGGG